MAIEMPDTKLVQMLVARLDDGSRIFVAGAKLTVGVSQNFFLRDAIVDADVGKVPYILVVMLRLEPIAPQVEQFLDMGSRLLDGRRTLVAPLATRETVCCETPAARATSAMETGRVPVSLEGRLATKSPSLLRDLNSVNVCPGRNMPRAEPAIVGRMLTYSTFSICISSAL